MAVDSEALAEPGAIRGAVLETWTSLRSVFVNPALRRIELALSGSMIGDWAYATAVVVWAYGAGGDWRRRVLPLVASVRRIAS